jgi:hypothetical protein
VRVFEKRVLRGIFEVLNEKLTGKWRKLHNEELLIIYFSPNTIRGRGIKKYDTGRTCSTHGR